MNGHEQYFLDAPVLLSEPAGKMWLIERQDGRLLFRCREGSGAQWDGGGLLMEKAGAFTAACAPDGSPLVLADDSLGRLYSAVPEANGWRSELVYNDPHKTISHPVAISCGATVHLVYLALDYKEQRWWLLHHQGSPGRWQEPQVIDFGSGININYASLAPGSGNSILIFYRRQENARYGLCLRLYDPVKGWGAAAVVSRPDTNNHFPSILIDGNQNIHLCWACFDGHYYTICHRVRTRGGWPGRGWQPESCLSLRANDLPFPVLYRFEQQLAVIWRQDGELFRRQLTENGWSAKLETLDMPGPVLYRRAGVNSAAFNGDWIFADSNPPVRLLEPFACPARDRTPLDDRLDDLENYSEHILQRANSFAQAKSGLEKALQGKNQELMLLSHRHNRQFESLQKQIEQRNQELQELENSFRRTIDEIRAHARKEKQETEQRLKMVKKESLRLKESLEMKTAELQKLQSRLKEAEERENALARQTRDLEGKVQRLEAELHNREASVWARLAGLIHKKP